VGARAPLEVQQHRPDQVRMMRAETVEQFLRHDESSHLNDAIPHQDASKAPAEMQSIAPGHIIARRPHFTPPHAPPRTAYTAAAPFVMEEDEKEPNPARVKLQLHSRLPEAVFWVTRRLHGR
jgi:hypothetical protein